MLHDFIVQIMLLNGAILMVAVLFSGNILQFMDSAAAIFSAPSRRSR